jgi:hypothetical protein
MGQDPIIHVVITHGLADLAPRYKSQRVRADVLLAISREFGKSLEWLLTGEE